MKTNLKQLRKKAGWNNADDFAAHIGMPAKTYRNYEQGVRKMGLDVACEICNALGCDLSELVASPIYYGVVALEDAPKDFKLDQHEVELIEMFRELDDDTATWVYSTIQSFYFRHLYEIGGNELLESYGVAFKPIGKAGAPSDSVNDE